MQRPERDQYPAWVPDEIHLITTGSDATRSARILREATPDPLASCPQAESLPQPIIHQVPGPAGKGLARISTSDEFEASSSFVAELLGRLTRDPLAEVYVALADGASILGHTLGYALSVYGRSQDRLFYFLPPCTSPGKKSPANEAPLPELINVPFLRVGAILQRPKQEALRNLLDFRSLIALANMELDPSAIQLNDRRYTVSYNSRVVRLAPLRYSLYRWLAQRHLEGRGPASLAEPSILEDFYCCTCQVFGALSPATEKVAGFVESILGPNGQGKPADCKLVKAKLSVLMSRANADLLVGVGPDWISRCEIVSQQPKRQLAYGLPQGVRIELLSPSSAE